tara:strand:- start:565 stop:1158 length:594 start_codon:yes stop_codon:yes gene_type:complete
MAFWNAKEAQPKRNYRFKVQITGFGADSIVWYAKTFKPPSYELSEATHDYLDNKYYWPGRVTWADVTMQLVDPVSPNAVYLTNKLLVDAGYKIKDSPTVADETVGKNKAATNAGNVIVEIVDADGAVIETWTLKNAWLKAASWSDLDYSNDELRTIDMTFRYDWAECLHGTTVPSPAGGETQFGTNTPGGQTPPANP